MAAIETPCVKICVLDTAAGICRGCGRTLNEIGRWAALSAEERRVITAQLPARLAILEPERECEP
ncbi:MAG: DUF1289 domain-containing protein [Pseudolabrys sp.]|nr:DUF1289 domain-containing protein [Pseudolabrys sp.]